MSKLKYVFNFFYKYSIYIFIIYKLFRNLLMIFILVELKVSLHELNRTLRSHWVMRMKYIDRISYNVNYNQSAFFKSKLFA